MEFEYVKQRLCVPPNNGFIWQKLQSITLVQGTLLMQVDGEPWMDWCLKGDIRVLQFTTNLLYHASFSWVSSKAQMGWDVCKSNVGWEQLLQHN